MMPLSDYQQQVELYLGCRNLRDASFFGKTNPRIRVYMQMSEEWTFLTQTERVSDSLNPDFKTTILIDFVFETRQPMRFEVFDIDENNQNSLIGTVETTLGEIMGSRKQVAILELLSNENKPVGKIIIRGDKTGDSKYRIFWTWSALNLKNLGGCFSKSSPFLRFFKQKGTDWLPVYETEIKKENLNPVWMSFVIEEDKICGGNYTNPIRIECWDHQTNKKHKLIGYADLTMDQIKYGQSTFLLADPKSHSSTGTLKLVKFNMEETPPSFIDYIRGGEQLSAIVAIDFTFSNKVPEDPTSLHAKFPDGSFNEYQQAIRSVCQLILNYDYDMMIPVFGFGAWLKYDTLSKGISHCFPCTGSLEQTQVLGVNGIMSAYQYALDHLDLSMPTYLAPVITEAVKACEINVKNRVEVYSILLILTDGDLQDMHATTEALHKASGLPISVIIIGIGEEDFTRVENLQNTEKFLVNSNGRVFLRNFIQFFPFKKYKNDTALLARHVLAGIPKQLVQYKMLIGKKPNPPIH